MSFARFTLNKLRDRGTSRLIKDNKIGSFNRVARIGIIYICLMLLLFDNNYYDKINPFPKLIESPPTIIVSRTMLHYLQLNGYLTI